MSCLMKVLDPPNLFQCIEPFLADDDLSMCMEVSHAVSAKVVDFFIDSITLDLSAYAQNLQNSTGTTSDFHCVCQTKRYCQLSEKAEEECVAFFTSQLEDLIVKSQMSYAALFSRIHATPLPPDQIEGFVFKSLENLTLTRDVGNGSVSTRDLEEMEQVTTAYLKKNQFSGALEMAKILRHYCSSFAKNFEASTADPFLSSTMYKNLKKIEDHLVFWYQHSPEKDIPVKIDYLYLIDQVAQEWLELNIPRKAKRTLLRATDLNIATRRKSMQDPQLAEAFLTIKDTYLQMGLDDRAMEITEPLEIM